MPKKKYSDEFKADAVELYETHPDMSYTQVAADLGVSRGAVKTWVYQSRKAAGAVPTGSADHPETTEDEIARLRVENADLLERQKRLRAENDQLAEERAILRKATKYFGGRDELVIRFQFVDDYRGTYEVKRMCAVLGIQRSSYYKWRATQSARVARQAADEALVERIRDHHEEWDHTYGYRRMTVELAEDPDVDGPVNHKRVARLMRANNIVGVHLRKPHITTVKDPGAQVFADLVKRDFTAAEVGTTYVGDITYLPYGTEGKFLYLATVIDVCSKRIVGWSIADHMRTSLVEDALYSAVNDRETLNDTIFHSDHGRQYTSSAFQATCRRLGVVQSMGRIGSSADNALAESVNAALKRETLQGAKRWDTAAQCRREVFRWLIRYNSRRRHSGLGYRAPVDFEFDCASMMDLAA
ncbi:MAG: IS3 family transposase [Brevibacterium sp.]|nr:IS3 family transposase [Brevibacterium sp.]MDN5806527.1 IS3 family transposase [Brevibacterium sp.]MDN5833142.1 IS3 family transposase [Brevibacterium sp.]MDN5876482.1 IS3 family transposase [Brevibacterium sp.]MDN5908683.1 IS3 family transposase [Brevibacterium sp.]MDN6133618.1 IS3 family transposase [Brevibacterium sp.]